MAFYESTWKYYGVIVLKLLKRLTSQTTNTPTPAPTPKETKPPASRPIVNFYFVG